MCERLNGTVSGWAARKKMRALSSPSRVTEMSWLNAKVPGHTVMTSPGDAAAIAERISASLHTSTTMPDSWVGPSSGR